MKNCGGLWEMTGRVNLEQGMNKEIINIVIIQTDIVK